VKVVMASDPTSFLVDVGPCSAGKA
jgi:hypothetical protein